MSQPNGMPPLGSDAQSRPTVRRERSQSARAASQQPTMPLPGGEHDPPLRAFRIVPVAVPPSSHAPAAPPRPPAPAVPAVPEASATPPAPWRFPAANGMGLALGLVSAGLLVLLGVVVFVLVGLR